MDVAKSNLLFGYIGHSNFGDELLLDYSISKIADGSRVVIITAGNKRVPLRQKHLDRLKIAFVPNSMMGIARSMITSSNIECIGGTCFHSNKSGFFKVQLIAMMLFKKINWKNVGFESTFAPTSFKKFTFLRSFGSMSVRDKHSAAVALKILGIATTVRADAAFDGAFLKDSVPISDHTNSYQPKIVVSIKESVIPYETKLEKIRNCIAEQRSDEVLVMPGCFKDNAICKRLSDDLGAPISTLDWEMQLGILSAAKVVIAERLHHQICGFTFGSIVYCFCYMEKNLNVFEDHQNSSKLIQL